MKYFIKPNLYIKIDLGDLPCTQENAVGLARHFEETILTVIKKFMQSKSYSDVLSKYPNAPKDAFGLVTLTEMVKEKEDETTHKKNG